MKLDKFTWSVIGVVVLLVIAAVITVNMTGGAGVQAQEYMPLDTPQAPVYNAFLALQRGEVTKAREQYSKEVLEQIDKDTSYDPFTGHGAGGGSSQRLRILKSEPATDGVNRALVSYVLDSYSQGGLFGSGSSYSREGTVEVVQEDDGWKINTQEFFW